MTILIRPTARALILQVLIILSGWGECSASFKLPKNESAVSELPDWFNRNRIQVHWEGPLLHVAEDGTPDKRFVRWLTPVHDWIEETGTSVTIGLAKRDGEGAWWPTQAGRSIPEAENRNLYQEFFLNALEKRGIDYIAYYRHDIEGQVANEHPDWRALDANGEPIISNRGDNFYRLSYNSPFRDFVRERLVELAKFGTKAIYFDEDHMPEVCTSDYSRKKFAKIRGYPMPENLKPYTSEYLDVARFTGETLYETFGEWKRAVQAINPDILFIAGNKPFVQFDGIHHTGTMANHIDALKIEFQKCFGGQSHWPGAQMRQMQIKYPDYYRPQRSLTESLAWSIARDAAGGRPAHIWNWKPNADYGETFHTNTALVASGNISSTHVDFFAKEKHYPKLFALNDKLGEFFADAQPYGWAAVHISNELKEKYYPANGDAIESYRQRFQHLYAPVLASVEALQREHFPYITYFDTDLHSGKINPETKVLIVPSFDLLSALQQNQIKKLEKNGLAVVRLSSEQAWHLSADVPQLQAKLLNTIGEKAGQPPFQLEAPAEVRANYFRNKGGRGLLVTAVRDWNDFWFFGDNQSNRRAQYPEKPALTGLEILLHDPAFRFTSAMVIDYEENAPLSMKTGSQRLSLPPMDIYKFIQLSR